MLDRLPSRFQPLDDRGEGGVVEEDSILGVVGDVDQLVVEQTRADRVEDAAHAAVPIPRVYVADVVLREGSDSLAVTDSLPSPRLGTHARLPRDVAPARATDRPSP